MTDNQSNSYQDILDKYAESISSKDNPEIPQEKIIPEPELEPITPPEPILTSEEETLLKSEPEEVFNPPQIEAPPVTEAITSPDVPETIISPPPQIELPLEPSEPMPKKENHFFKYLFFFSLIIFIIVLVLVIISFINSQKPISNSRDIPNNNISPTSLPVTFCEINDQKHAVGTTFSANDSCNTCTCGEDLTINCTTKTCDATPSVKLSPTKSATTSAIPADWKTYTNSTYNLSFKYPSGSIVKNNNYTGYLATFIVDKISSVEPTTTATFYIGSTDESKTYTDTKLTKVAGLDAIRISLPMGQNPPQELVFFTKDNKYYHFQFVWDGKTQKDLETFNQILSTFKFL